MPQVIGAVVLWAIGLSEVAGLTILGVSYATIIGTTVLAVASAAFSGSSNNPGTTGAPAMPKQDGQLSLLQPTPFRRRGYGRMKMGGYFVFWTSVGGTLYSLLAILAHEIDGFEEDWVSDRKVALDGDGYVTSVTAPADADPAQFNPGGKLVVRILRNLGAPGKTAYASLVAAFPTVWTDDHIGKGIADVLLSEAGVEQTKFTQVYPGGQQSYRALLRGAKIYDPTDHAQNWNDPTTFTWNDNSVLVTLDYLCNADGWRMDYATFLSGQALAITMDAIAVCDELVPLKSGGHEKRYRLWGFYDFNEEPRHVLARFLASFGGWMQPMPDGTIAIRAGKWVTPDFTITDDMILGFDVQHFVSEFDAINEIRATFNYAQNDYQDTETAPWQNEADIALRGYIKSTSIDARHCPTFTQTRRIQKIAYHEASPAFTIQLQCTSAAIGARNRKFIDLEMTQLGLFGSYRVTSLTVNLKTGVVSISLASFSAAAYDWDPDNDEGAPPGIPTDSASSGGIETPTSLAVSVETRTIAGSAVGAVMSISCDPPVLREDLTVKFEYQPDGSDSWTTISQGTQTYMTETPILADGTYNVRASFMAASGVQGDFAEVDGVIVAASAAAPTPPTGLSVHVGSPASHVVVAATAPNDAGFGALRFWRNSVNVFGTANDISGPLYGSPNQSFDLEDVPGIGTWYYWATAESATGSRSSPTGPVTITI